MIDKQRGGVGIHDLALRNKAYGGKLVWKMLNKLHNMWCMIMKSKYLDPMDPIHIIIAEDLPQGSQVWNFLASLREVIIDYVSWEINDGHKA